MQQSFNHSGLANGEEYSLMKDEDAQAVEAAGKDAKEKDKKKKDKDVPPESKLINNHSL